MFGYISLSRPVSTKNIGLKDWNLAVDYAKSVGADIPVTKFIHKLDTQSVYSALAEAQKKQ